MCRGERYSIPGLLDFTLNPHLIMLSVKKVASSTIFESLVWLDLELNSGLLDHWPTLYWVGPEYIDWSTNFRDFPFNVAIALSWSKNINNIEHLKNNKKKKQIRFNKQVHWKFMKKYLKKKQTNETETKQFWGRKKKVRRETRIQQIHWMADQHEEQITRNLRGRSRYTSGIPLRKP